MPFLVSRHALPVVSFDAEWLAFVLTWACMLGSWLLVRTQARGGKLADVDLPSVPKIAALPFGWVALLCIQFLMLAAHGVFVHDANAWRDGRLAGLNEPLLVLMAVLYGMGLLAAVTAGRWAAAALGRDRVMTWLAWGLLAGGLLSVGAETMQALRVDVSWGLWVSRLVVDPAEAGARRLYGNLAQPNHLGTYLAWSVAAAWMLAGRAGWESPGNRGRYSSTARAFALVLAMTVIFAGMAATGSRTAIVQMAMIAVGAGLFEGIGRGGRHGLPRAVRTGVIAAAFVAALATAAYVGTAWISRHAGLDLAVDGMHRLATADESGYRRALALTALDVWREHPWFGAGWGELCTEFLALAGRYGFAEPAASAHNVVLDVLAQTGLFGAIVVFVPIVAWVVRVARSLRYRSGAGWGQVLSLWLLALLGVHMLLEFPEQFAYFLLPAGLIMGLCDARDAPAHADRPACHAAGWYRARHASAAHLLGVLVFAGAVGCIWVRADYARAQAAFGWFGGYAYVAQPSVLFANFGEFGMAMQEPLGPAGQPDEIRKELRDIQMALHVSAAPAALERQVVLLALAGRREEELRAARQLWWIAGRHRAEAQADLDAMFRRAGLADRWATVVAVDVR
ncbi:MULTISPECIES: PglL family O-oligosaccharyltransferase [unclassified Burkholderia]|uniref:PglL family O-oligosaccharyltransferase n=1 Tax=unclassified Burkholderia TaxID=2613784 RepID=UPI002AAF81BA|nr:MULTISPECIES: Wzy polymerase domain-containing protein [unclassified Burkholderia]